MTRIIGIVSGKGGVGKTTVASNLGIALSKLNKKVIIIDCNITSPHLAYYLGVKNYSITLNDVLRNEVDIRFAPIYQNGVMFIPCSKELKDVIKVEINGLKKYIERLSQIEEYDFILLDSAPGLGKDAISVLKASEEIIFVTTPTIPNVYDMTRCAEFASQLGQKKFHIILNMVRNKKFELRKEVAEDFFGVPVLGTIPFDENLMDSAAQGIPIILYKPYSKASISFMKIASKLTGIGSRTSFLSNILSLFKKITPL
ncbi:MAG: P-loop NTPase [Candidatus Aenigmatarchaeota archaeon]